MLIITLMGNWQMIVWGLILGMILLGTANKWRYAWALLTSVSVGILFTELMKQFMGRPRPPIINSIITEKSLSFPSGHSYFAIVFYGLVTYFWVKHFKNQKVKIGVGILGIGLCLLIGISRIYLGVHWATDVMAGFASSTAWLLMAIAYLEYKNKFLEEKSGRFSNRLIWQGFWLFTLLWLSGLGLLFWAKR
jgi:undecaprenyl-diphosphatase